MSASAPRGRAPKSTSGTGLLTAWDPARSMPDPPGLDAIRGNNRKALRVLAKLIHCLCDGRPGARFYLGCKRLATEFERSPQTICNWLAQLERQGIIRRVWVGKRCRKDVNGVPYADGKPVNRASEFVFLGYQRRETAAENLEPVLSRPRAHPATRRRRPARERPKTKTPPRGRKIKNRRAAETASRVNYAAGSHRQ